MEDFLHNEVVTGALAILIAAAVGALFLMWRDVGILKHDVDGLAEVIGTERSKARKKKCS